MPLAGSSIGFGLNILPIDVPSEYIALDKSTISIIFILSIVRISALFISPITLILIRDRFCSNVSKEFSVPGSFYGKFTLRYKREFNHCRILIIQSKADITVLNRYPFEKIISIRSIKATITCCFTKFCPRLLIVIGNIPISVFNFKLGSDTVFTISSIFSIYARFTISAISTLCLNFLSID